MSLFSFLNKGTKTIMVFHNHELQLLQFDPSKGGLKMLAYNELSPTAGILENGRIVNMDAFETVLEGLFTQAQPKAIKDRELYVNVPCNLLYTFVQDSSHKASESVLRESILEAVEKHYPVPLKELVMNFDSVEKGHKISYAAYSWSKKWNDRFVKVCHSVGITSVHFIPEPFCYKALNDSEVMQEDMAIFAYCGSQIFLSLFHNGLLYDSYLVNEVDTEGVDVMNLSSEFKKSQKDFEGRFGTSIQFVTFAGFEKKYQKEIKKHFDTSSSDLGFLEPRSSRLRELLPYEINKTALFGLFDIISHDQ